MERPENMKSSSVGALPLPLDRFPPAFAFLDEERPRWVEAVLKSDCAALMALNESSSGAFLSDSAVARTGTATIEPHWNCQVNVTPALLCADHGLTEPLTCLLKLGADITTPTPVFVDPTRAYEPDSDDKDTWLAPMTVFDRAVERGHAGCVRVLWEWLHDLPLSTLSERTRLGLQARGNACGNVCTAAHTCLCKLDTAFLHSDIPVCGSSPRLACWLVASVAPWRVRPPSASCRTPPCRPVS